VRPLSANICFDTLVDGDGIANPLVSLLCAELGATLRSGVVTALLVSGLLLAAGVEPARTTAAAAVGAVLGALVHAGVSLLGAVALRWRTEARDAPTPTRG